ncbi:MAG: hypothetical protein QMC90_04325 [Dehalococcoidales bacterium]|nr:hypothetical protein [Dehalococcoidales bacterium]
MELARIFSGKKFMWDGKVYNDGREAGEVAQKYRSDGFEVKAVEEGGQWFLFTRRVVK